MATAKRTATGIQSGSASPSLALASWSSSTFGNST